MSTLNQSSFTQVTIATKDGFDSSLNIIIIKIWIISKNFSMNWLFTMHLQFMVNIRKNGSILPCLRLLIKWTLISDGQIRSVDIEQQLLYFQICYRIIAKLN